LRRKGFDIGIKMDKEKPQFLKKQIYRTVEFQIEPKFVGKERFRVCGGCSESRLIGH
jgi:hypothetical protein